MSEQTTEADSVLLRAGKAVLSVAAAAGVGYGLYQAYTRYQARKAGASSDAKSRPEQKSCLTTEPVHEVTEAKLLDDVRKRAEMFDELEDDVGHDHDHDHDHGDDCECDHDFDGFEDIPAPSEEDLKLLEGKCAIFDVDEGWFTPK